MPVGTPPLKVRIANAKTKIEKQMVEGTAEHDGLEP
jgi:hypothetical protein